MLHQKTRHLKMKWQTRKLTSNQVGLKYGFRSGLEIAISEELDLNKVKYEFEKD